MALHFTTREFIARQQRTIEQLKLRQLDGLLMFRQESMYYLSGYDSFGYVFFQCLYLDLDGNLIARYTGATSGPDEFRWLGEYVVGGKYKETTFTRYKRERREASAGG